MSGRRLMGLVTLGPVAAVLMTGCDSLTRDRFEMIVVEVSERVDVERTLGPPTIRSTEQWHYERPERHLNVLIDFDESGVVLRKQWIDATSGEWSDTAEAGETDSRETTRVRTVK